MKRKLKLTSVAAGLTALVVAGSAYAGSFIHRGIFCKTNSAGVMCMRDDGVGYGIGINRAGVIVMNSHQRVVFQRFNIGG